MTPDQEARERVLAFLSKHNLTEETLSGRTEMSRMLGKLRRDQLNELLIVVVKFKYALLLMQQTALPGEGIFITADRALKLAENWPFWLRPPLVADLDAFCDEGLLCFYQA